MRCHVLAATLAAALVLAAATPVAGQHAPSEPTDTSGEHAPDAPDNLAAHVSIGFADYRPATVQILAGDTVLWRNDSARSHTVTDDAAAYDSGRLPIGRQYSHRFEHVGRFPYHCRLHPGVRGAVEARTLLLDRPEEAAEVGRPFPLRGRAALPPDTSVSIEVDEGLGGGFRPAGTTVVGPEGSFTALVTPSRSATFRAVAGAEASPAVQVLVLDRAISARSRRGRTRTVVSVHVTPADPGAIVVLQLELRERFGWWPVARARLDRASRARFVLRRRQRVRARAVLTLPDGATPLATSRTLRIGPPVPGGRGD